MWHTSRQSLRDEERRGILETHPETKCAVFGYDGREVAVNGEMIFDQAKRICLASESDR
jgi:hypothetical protein